jgi:WhiB family redox-sensing transcriptional regulator
VDGSDGTADQHVWLDRPSWQHRAACRGTRVHFGVEGESWAQARDREARARAVCAGCPVRADCFGVAVANRERHGVWGGFSFETHRDRPSEWRTLQRLIVRFNRRQRALRPTEGEHEVSS